MDEIQSHWRKKNADIATFVVRNVKYFDNSPVQKMTER